MCVCIVCVLMSMGIHVLVSMNMCVYACTGLKLTSVRCLFGLLSTLLIEAASHGNPECTHPGYSGYCPREPLVSVSRVQGLQAATMPT